MTTELYIGLMSGTSMDGIDAALVAIDEDRCTVEHTLSRPWPEKVRHTLSDAITERSKALQAAQDDLNRQLGLEFASAARHLLAAAKLAASDVTAIGSHGQTVWHAPDEHPPFSLQLGHPQTIADATGLKTVADFRTADLQHGGQGAPLAPAFHRWAFSDQNENRAVVNIGGIANVTLLPAGGTVTGFDTGPGNNLLDGWIRRQRHVPFDDGGRWAAGGAVDQALLDLLASDEYFSRPPPKSTGFEYFNQTWLDRYLAQSPAVPDPQQVQSTLCELTVLQIVAGLNLQPAVQRVAVCGGGAANRELMGRLERRLPNATVSTTTDWNIDPDWVEAAAFAWLARQRLHGLPSNLPSVTGAAKELSLGRVFLPNGQPG